MKKDWYVAVIIVALRVEGRTEKRQVFDRQVKLLQASSHTEAFKKAVKLGKSENQKYQNPKGKTVTWHFVGLADLELLREKLEDGVEVYSILRRGNPDKEVLSKKNLSVFWYESNKHKKVGELLTRRNRPYIPERIPKC